MMAPMLHLKQIAGMSVSSVALGTAGWGPRDDVDFDALYGSYRATGGNCIDSAHCYAFWLDRLGAPERIVGELVRRNNDRKNVIICTKGCHISGGEKYPRPAHYMAPDLLASDITDSLERMQIDTIDLYYLHRDEPAVPVGEILDALHAEQMAGRIRHYAASNWSPERLDEAFAYCRNKGIPPFVASQVLYTLGHLTKAMPPDIKVLPAGQETWYVRSQMPLFAYSPNANGYFNDRQKGSYDNATSAARLDRCRELAANLDATPSQIALAYLMNQPFPVVAITGATKLDHLNDAIGADKVHLTQEQLRWLVQG